MAGSFDPPAARLKTCRGPVSRRPINAGQNPPADQVAQRLAGAPAERAVAGAPVKARYRELVCEAVAAMHLDRLARYPERHLVADHLGYRASSGSGNGSALAQAR
jgi:hypothetical protein